VPHQLHLGEEARAVLLSVTEGEDSRSNTRHFPPRDLMVLNKIDLLPYVPFSAEVAKENARRVQPDIEILDVSAPRAKASTLARLAGRSL